MKPNFPVRIEIEPVPAPRMVQSDRWAKRPCVQRYFAFRDELFMKVGGWVPVPCTLVFELAMPAGWTDKKKALMDGKPHESRPDLDNLTKACFDALLKEDGHIWSFRAEKYWGYKGSITIKEGLT